MYVAETTVKWAVCSRICICHACLADSLSMYMLAYASACCRASEHKITAADAIVPPFRSHTQNSLCANADILQTVCMQAIIGNT